MQPNFDFRPATADDIPPLLELYEHLSSDNVPCPPDIARDNLERLTRISGSAVLIGLRGGQIVTSCTLIVIPNLTRGGLPFAVIENVVTHPDHRRQGYGKAILDAASDRAWAEGCYKVMLSTGSKRPATLQFYEGAGFEQSRTGFQKRRVPPRG